jgi:hypothetical protein
MQETNHRITSLTLVRKWKGRPRRGKRMHTSCSLYLCSHEWTLTLEYEWKQEAEKPWQSQRFENRESIFSSRLLIQKLQSTRNFFQSTSFQQQGEKGWCSYLFQIKFFLKRPKQRWIDGASTRINKIVNRENETPVLNKRRVKYTQGLVWRCSRTTWIYGQNINPAVVPFVESESRTAATTTTSTSAPRSRIFQRQWILPKKKSIGATSLSQPRQKMKVFLLGIQRDIWIRYSHDDTDTLVVSGGEQRV